MIKVLFLIHDLGQGGAEKVLVNLVNNMDPGKFDITVMSLFGGGVNEQFLKPHIRHFSCFRHMIRGNSHLMKLLTPRQLHRWLIREKYDVEISYLEGPTARIVSGCPHQDVKILTWIHCLPEKRNVTLGFRSYQEARDIYSRFEKVICVSKTAQAGFRRAFPGVDNVSVIYNTNDSTAILNMAGRPVADVFRGTEVRLVGVGKLIPVKAFDRLLRIHARLRGEGYPIRTYILGEGSLRAELEAAAKKLGIADSISFLGFQKNVYKYVSKCDLFVCSSLSEGFSTAATEALIVGTPVCTVEVSGMKEMLGEHNEYGIVTENSEEALYRGIKTLLDDPALLAHYKQKAAERGKAFRTEETVHAVEQMLLDLME